MSDRIAVYRATVDAALDTDLLRQYIVDTDGDGDEHCRQCREIGEYIVICDTCSAPYDIKCAGLENQIINNIGTWNCPLCLKNRVPLVSDCPQLTVYGDNRDQTGLLGFDRHGQRYRFLSRRIWVETRDGECVYYSTVQKFNELVAALHIIEYDAELANVLNRFGDEIIRQMNETIEQTNSRKPVQRSDTFLGYINDFRKYKNNYEREKYQKLSESFLHEAMTSTLNRASHSQFDHFPSNPKLDERLCENVLYILENKNIF